MKGWASRGRFGGVELLAFCAMLPHVPAADACKESACLSQVQNDGSPIIVTTPAQTPEPIWSHPIARSDVPPDKLVLIGVTKDGRFAPESVSVPEEPSERAVRRTEALSP